MARNPAAESSAPHAISLAQRDRLCEQYFTWAERFLRQSFGAAAAEFAGEGIFQAAATFDPAKGVPFLAWAAKNLEWVYRGYQRQEFGGVRAHMVSLDAPIADTETLHFDPESQLPAPEAALTADEAWSQVAERIDNLNGTPRWIVIGRFFGGFTHDRIARIIQFNPQHLSRLFAQLRRSVPAP
jgi:DNA-directed RNA polymerase specialized sigma24 family protein